MSRALRLAAVGAGAAATLAALECAALLLLPRLGDSPLPAPHLHGGFLLLLLALYSSLGAGLGAALAPATRLAPGRAGALGVLTAGAVAWLAAAALAAALQRPGAVELPPPPGAVQARPDVVLVTLDTVRGDHLSVYGYPRDTTPVLEAFARRATLHTRAYAAANLTLPSHASLFTGLHARHHGARDDPRLGSRQLEERFRTLAEILAGAGYLGAAFVGNPYLSARLGFAQGFHAYDERQPPPFIPALRAPLPARFVAGALGAAGPAGLWSEPYRRASAVNRGVFAWLDAAARRPEPLFLFVNYMDPHWPYDPPPPFRDRYPGRLSSAPAPEAFHAARRLERSLGPAERDHYVALYDAEIAYTDAELGRLFERLERDGRFDGALVVVTSDHGEAFGEHGLVEHGVSLHQHQVRVPLLIKYPGQERPAVSDTPASGVDLLPTILAVLGLPRPRALPGVDLRGPPAPRAPVVSESYPSPALARAHPRLAPRQTALVSGDLKLIATESGGRELFDLERDPQEQRDLYPGHARAAEIERELEGWLGARPGTRAAPASLDPETEERLRALGYAP